MCQLLGMNCNTPTDIIFSFEGFRMRGGLTDHHIDGFGIGFFERKGVRLFHDDKPSAQSPVADLVNSYQIKSENVIAHIRKATQGTTSLANTHPFIRELWGEYWMFAHNGHLENFHPPRGQYYRPVGTTDSERAFCFILEELRQRFDEKPDTATLFATVSTLFLYYNGVDTHIGTFFRQGQALFAGSMLAISSVFTAIVTYIWYRCFAKKNGMNIDEIDLKTSAFSVFKTIMLALTVTGGTLLLVWGAQYFFKTNFSFLYWGIMPFGSFKIVDMLKVLPIFLIGYVISSIFINCMNYNTSYGKNKIVNILVLALVTAAVPALVSGAGWAKFMLTGVNDLFGAAYTRIPDSMFLTVFLLFITPLTARGIYSKTRNPYLGGIINAILAMVITCVNCQVVFPA